MFQFARSAFGPNPLEITESIGGGGVWRPKEVGRGPFQNYDLYKNKDLLLGLIWVQPVCDGYQQTTLAGNVCVVLMLYFLVNNFSVMSGHFLGLASIILLKETTKCLCVWLEPGTS